MAYVEVEVDIDEYLDEAGTKYLIEELESRDFKVIPKGYDIIKDKDKDFKALLCDHFGISYHTKKDTLLNKVSGII